MDIQIAITIIIVTGLVLALLIIGIFAGGDSNFAYLVNKINARKIVESNNEVEIQREITKQYELQYKHKALQQKEQSLNLVKIPETEKVIKKRRQ